MRRELKLFYTVPNTYSDKVIPEEALFLAGRVKEAIFSEGGTLTKKNVLTINSEVRSLVRKELKIRPEGGERINMAIS